MCGLVYIAIHTSDTTWDWLLKSSAKHCLGDYMENFREKNIIQLLLFLHAIVQPN